MSDCIHRILKNKSESSQRLCGYIRISLINHLESLFEDGFTWSNHRKVWHIDHIKPINAFLDEGITDPKMINALDNLRPIRKEENLKKNCKYEK